MEKDDCDELDTSACSKVPYKKYCYQLKVGLKGFTCDVKPGILCNLRMML
jgi:hypothetical protein